ncbi:MAG: hypothetical protein HQK83_17075 [Fibrobacteria bacterium]|nr:hypothetical protein [Fibrobacteria bacterium]
MYHNVSNRVHTNTTAALSKNDAAEALTDHFIKKLNTLTGKYVTGVSREVLDFIRSRGLIGNIQQLEQVIEYGYALCDDLIIGMEHLPEKNIGSDYCHTQNNVDYTYRDYKSSIKEEMILLLEKYRGNKTKTAKTLGIDRTTLWRRMKKYNLI